MIFGSVSVAAFAWDATTDDGFNLDITTKIFREVNGEWVETEKVKKVKMLRQEFILILIIILTPVSSCFSMTADFSQTLSEQDTKPLRLILTSLQALTELTVSSSVQNHPPISRIRSLIPEKLLQNLQTRMNLFLQLIHFQTPQRTRCSAAAIGSVNSR